MSSSDPKNRDPTGPTGASTLPASSALSATGALADSGSLPVTDNWLRALVYHALDVVAVFELDRSLRFVSPSVERVLGYEPSALLDSQAQALLHPDDLEAVKARLAEGIARPNALMPAVEVRVRHADGSWRHLEVIGKVLTKSGQMTGVIVNARDVTARLQMDQAMRRSESNFRALIERSPDAIVVHRHGAIVYANPTALEYLGRGGPDDVVGRSILELVHPDDRAFVTERVARLVATGEPAPPHEIRFLLGDGRAILAETMGMSIVFDGEPAVLVTLRDLTERRKMQAQLVLSDRLASVGTLAAGVAHELNNPLAYVVANVGFAREELARAIAAAPDPASRARLEEVLEALTEADEGATRMREIVRGLNIFSRGDDERRDRVNLRAALDSAVTLAKNEIRHRARLVQRYGDLPLVLGNELRVGQVFLNLLVNAAQALPEGDPGKAEIRITGWAEDGRVIVEVADTGAGIPPEALPRIFDPFFTTKPLGVGTGLGLSICHGIVTGLGGAISATSELGKGTTFRVTLPVADKPLPVRILTPVPPSQRRKARVLVIDDEPLVTRSVQRILAAMHDVTTTTSAREGLELIAGGARFDVILCDLMMPDVTGMDFHAELTRSAPDQAARIAFLSGGAFTPRAREFVERVGNVMLEKPFDAETLRALVRGMIG